MSNIAKHELLSGTDMIKSVAINKYLEVNTQQTQMDFRKSKLD